MGEVIHQTWGTTLDLNPEVVLNAAVEANLDNVIVIGWTKDGTLYFATSKTATADILLSLEAAKHSLLNQAFEEI
jgi:hypothetical protein